MFQDEKELLTTLETEREKVAALAALCERYKMALEAAAACDYQSDAEKIVKLALRSS